MPLTGGAERALRGILARYPGKWFLVGPAMHLAFRDVRIDFFKKIDIAIEPGEARAHSSLFREEFVTAGFTLTSFISSKANFLVEAEGYNCRIRVGSLNRIKPDEPFSNRFLDSMERGCQLTDTVSVAGVNFIAPFSRETYKRVMENEDLLARLVLAARFGALVAVWKLPSPARLAPFSANRLRRFSKSLSSRVCEFPRPHQSQIDRFDSWDEKLGWDNKPEVSKLDKSDRGASFSPKSALNPVIFSTDRRGSRAPKYQDEKALVSIYGDSYAMCRDVNDNETVAWKLAEICGANVTNYGVGNYGLDQAILKLEDNFASDPTPNVVVAVTTITMARCVSVYRHYLEPGNVLAIKPRFETVEGDGILLRKNPISKKQEFRSLGERKLFFREVDDHYAYWRRSRLHLLRNVPAAIARWAGGSPEASHVLGRFEYEASFWRSHEDLFLALISRLSSFSKRQGFRAFFLLQHQERSLSYAKQRGKDSLPWTSALSKAASLNPEVTFLDELEFFRKFEDEKALYSRSHHSPLANQLVAQSLNIAISQSDGMTGN